MTKFETWIESTKQSNTSLFLLEKDDYWRLFSLKKAYWVEHNIFYHTSYHIWNVATEEWNTTTNYKDAIDLYKNRTNAKEEI